MGAISFWQVYRKFGISESNVSYDLTSQRGDVAEKSFNGYLSLKQTLYQKTNIISLKNSKLLLDNQRTLYSI